MSTTGQWGLVSAAASGQPALVDLDQIFRGESLIDVIAIACLVIVGLVLAGVGVKRSLGD